MVSKKYYFCTIILCHAIINKRHFYSGFNYVIIINIMNKPFSLIILLLLSSCYTQNNIVKFFSVGPEYVEYETLIYIPSTVTIGGNICFLRKMDDKCEYLDFVYGIDLNEKYAYGKLIQREIYEIGDERIPYRHWRTAKGLASNYKRLGKRYKYLEKCFNCLSDSFLQLSNDKKIEVLKKYSRKEEWSYNQLSEKKITWKSKNFLENICLDDTCQIIDWCCKPLPFASPYSTAINNVNEKRFFVLFIQCFSMFSRTGVYVFKEEKQQWILVAEGKIIDNGISNFTSDIESDKQKILVKQWDRFTKFNYEERELPCNDNSQEKKKITISSVNWSNAEPIIVGELNVDDL